MTSATGPLDDVWPRISVERKLSRARKEWLHTNGAGAYAGSTVAGMHTRRYHGLLVAALDPPRARHVALSHIDATVTLAREGREGPASSARPRGAVSSFRAGPGARDAWELGKHQFPGVDPEAGAFYLERFDQDPLPRWTYAVAGGTLEVTLGLVRGENAVVLRYAFQGPEPVVLTLRPLLAMRHFHHLQQENGGVKHRVELRAGEVRMQPKSELPKLCIRFDGTFVGSPDWWRRFEYLTELARGLDYLEDLWTPGVLEVRCEGAPAYLVAAVDHLPEGEPAALLAAARDALAAEDPGPKKPLLTRRLAVAAEVFRADLAPKPGVIAGYPWFEVWGRDTLIALPGLYLSTGKIDGAIRILREMIAAMRDGLVPNRIPDVGEAAEFHTADATLWLFEAARQVAAELSAGHAFVTGELLPALRGAFEAAQAGTRNAIHITPDGLFAAGKGEDSLTWMDARVDGHPVTPRVGCPVELSALWARGCETLARMARAGGNATLVQQALAARDRARASFRERFWCQETGYPYDVISEARDGAGSFRDASIRPNAVIALAVDPGCFTTEQATGLLDRAKRELVTSAGLRTLAPSDPRYRGKYEGGVAQRDGAYHQGTVWPWLLGPYVTAARRGPEGERRVGELRELIAAAAANDLAVGQVPEIADGDAPHRPAGCVAQAWSVAELLRAASLL
jgi:predicted glycogen debranching enzyme